MSATSVTLSVTVLEAGEAWKLRVLKTTAERATGTANAVRKIDMVGDQYEFRVSVGAAWWETRHSIGAPEVV